MLIFRYGDFILTFFLSHCTPLSSTDHLYGVHWGARILPPRLVREVLDIGLWEVCQIDAFPLDMALINALVHLFQPETRTFPFPCEETGITLEAVTRILGVGSDGLPLRCDPPFDDRSFWGEVIEMLGDVPPKERRWDEKSLP
ncbi:hypothetical protein AMTRI_Chr04g183260 [Amborella trichopoda]|uniref:Aminotransferase-like plant mobile domain-containing protein n=1 Tax=Amborella trichopoda TaxID=13333 RepID=W1NHW9_AMBTC|nr:hypothetical protein AMTR_s00008p00209600 [Amborella trichopoda]